LGLRYGLSQWSEEKMRCILTLALFFTCLSTASAADDPVTKRDNDASLRKTQHVQFAPLARYRAVKPGPRGN